MRASELDGSLDARDAIKWQDENVHVKIQLGIALDFLEALLRISGNNSNNGENFPPSAACCHFSREEIFCHLVQALLRAKTPVFTRILEIIITLTKANKTAMSHLYKLGAFEILLWKLLASDIVDGDKSRITKFLSQTHLLQVFLLQLAFLSNSSIGDSGAFGRFLLSRNIHEKPTRRSDPNAVCSSR
jgi:DnaJ family protein C protein 13